LSKKNKICFYLYGVIKTLRNISVIIVFLMGSVLSLNLTHQMSDSRKEISANPEYGFSNFIFTDAKLFAEDQLTNQIQFACYNKATISDVCFNKVEQLSKFNFTIWQPPKNG